jgi:mono/diheme cytochrome c family protein
MSHVIQWTATVVLCTVTLSKAETAFRPEIPRIWDEEAFRDMELPLVVPKYSPKPVPADYYYKIPTRQIYKSYPVYAPGRGPKNYLETLQTLEPQVIFDAAKLQTKQDWVRAGELVFEAPTAYEVSNMSARDVSDPAWYTYTGVRLTADGVLPHLRYVIREKGKVGVGSLGCMNCHLSVLQDGTVIKAGQGNFPMDRVSAMAVRRFPLPVGRRIFLQLYTIPWIPERQKQFESYSAEEIVAILEAVPAGVLGRNRSSAHTPPAVPDLYGVRYRRYLDKSGLTRHKGIVDLMRYAAMAEGIEGFSSFDGFIPRGGEHFNRLPPPESLTRFSEEQLYALALWLYSLEPPRNPRPPEKRLTERGRAVFRREGCGTCHTAPLYTNNKLTPAIGFNVPPEHRSRYDVLSVVVGTDPRLTIETLRGTGYYKIPSLRGLWYRGPFEHSGSVATLEDWFNSARLREDYVPTGFKGYGVHTRAVKGHEFGLQLSAEDKAALIAFLKTL